MGRSDEGLMAGRVLVVGGGVAGFGVARALSLRRVPCTLVERLEAAPASVLGLNLPGNAVRALGTLGVGDEAVRSGRPILRREYRTSADRILFEVDEAEFWSRVAPVQAATDKLSRIAGLPIWLRDLVGPVLGPRTYREAYGPLRTPLSPVAT